MSPAATLAEAIVLASDQIFDVAILDVSPDGPSAAVMVDLLRARGLLPQRFVVCIPTGFQEETDFMVVLRKPYPFEHLLDAVFGPSRAMRQSRSGVFVRGKEGDGLSLRLTRRATPGRRVRG